MTDGPTDAGGSGYGSSGLPAGLQLGPYVVERPIGEGAMGRVYVARDQRLDRLVAIKVVLGEASDSDEFRIRFQREAATLARLDSPHVISIYDHGELDGVPYIVTQYAAGGDLGALLSGRGPMPPALAARLCAQVADALVAAHAVGVVHRDVKPANVLLRDERLDRLHVYLCDFGVVLTEASGLTSPGSVAGTWNYLAPERVDGEHGSPASDIYAVGCLLYEALTGRPPYAGSDVEVALAHVHAPLPYLPGEDETTRYLNHVIGRCMAKDPAARYATAVELRDELRALEATFSGQLAGRRSGSVAGATPTGSRAASRSRRRLLVAGGTVLALLVAGGVAYAVRGGGSGGGPDPTRTAAASTKPTVFGDIDGDGYGDIGWSDTDAGYLHLSTGAGQGLAAQTVRRIGAKDPTVVGDVQGAGHEDLVSVVGSPPTLAATIVSAAPSHPTSTLTVPVSTGSFRLDTPLLALADVDGDGHADLVVGTFTDGGKTVTLSVARSDGSVGFEAPSTWGTVTVDDATKVTSYDLVVGDLDGDGHDDVGLVEVNVGKGGDEKLQMLMSDGTKLTPTGSRLDLGPTFGSDYVLLDYLALADVDGSGHLQLVGVESFQPEVLTWSWSDGTFSTPHVAYAVQQATSDADRVGMSDVDGDGRADVVLVGDKSTSVLRAGGSADDVTFTPDPVYDLAVKAPIVDIVLNTARWDPY